MSGSSLRLPQGKRVVTLSGGYLNICIGIFVHTYSFLYGVGDTSLVNVSSRKQLLISSKYQKLRQPRVVSLLSPSLLSLSSAGFRNSGYRYFKSLVTWLLKTFKHELPFGFPNRPQCPEMRRQPKAGKGGHVFRHVFTQRHNPPPGPRRQALGRYCNAGTGLKGHFYNNH